MKSSASSSGKFAHVTVRSWEAVKGARRAFILTLDSLPGRDRTDDSSMPFPSMDYYWAMPNEPERHRKTVFMRV